MNYLSIIKDLSNIISIKDVKNKFKNNYKNIINVYGTYEAFIKDQEDENSDLRTIRFFRKNKYLFEKVKEEKAYILVCRMNYFHYLKSLINYFIWNYKKKNDLNFSARVKISYYKAIRNVLRTKYYIDIDKYFWKKEICDNIIKELFEIKAIDNIYIYIGKNYMYGIKSKVIEKMEKQYKKEHPKYED